MCGIAGAFCYADPDRPVDRELVTRMTRALAHRGPDAEGFWFGGNIGFGHRRLSIVDLSATGAQPMANDDETCWLNYNGEFYNHREFRPRLAARGARFRGPSDTETLLRLLEEGPESLADVAGIFAFAFYDGRSKTLTLARDHLGVKQIYFHDDGRRILFASEIKALLEDPAVTREVDPEAVSQYLHFHTALFERTFFRGIRQLLPGEFMRVTRYAANVRRYWALDDFSKFDAGAGQMVEQLQHQLSQVVGQQLMSDVPVGSFFSGGIDSSAIAAQASRSGTAPLCFGVHFSDQGVTDERPFQEAAAQALGLELHLITMDGEAFPDEFGRLIRQQDEPVIGPAMFPMARVSQLAARHVKVCLGGQAADEVFGGYARYALGRPLHVVRSWFAGRYGVADPALPSNQPGSKVGGNLSRQFAEGGTIVRLARNARHLANWETSYFEHFAKVAESSWLRIFDSPDFCSRERSRSLFHEVVRGSPARDPLDKIMHWDVQTYLTGLFHQDDRMSMASGLESRVPFADPRLVKFAFRIDPDLKLRAGASKWILRQAVADVLPSLVLNRRKVGFDTPAQRWMTESHADFVRETLLSTRARQRGFWNPRGLQNLLDHSREPGWFDIAWKALSIELWAASMLDSAPLPSSNTDSLPPEVIGAGRPEPPSTRVQRAAYLARECRELGVKGTVARGLWEVKTRSGFARLQSVAETRPVPEPEFPGRNAPRLPFTPPDMVAAAMRDLVPRREVEALARLASEATRGRILSFSKWTSDCGNPIDWHRDPVTGHRWSRDAHWSSVLQGSRDLDVKFTWEAARFPHAYAMGRAATFLPESAPDLAAAFTGQVIDFVESNPPGRGVHWFSGQEVALRLLAWLFGFHVFYANSEPSAALRTALGSSLPAAGSHINGHIAYARDSIYNNHLLSEALGLYICGSFAPGPAGERWREEGMRNLNQQAPLQIYPDGGYIQQAHNYHRVAMQLYLWAHAFRRANSETTPPEWISAMERSLDFLLAHQNPEDGRLPNFGANDGSYPVILSAGDVTDFRPVLQSLSIATRGERIYHPGPWDEMAVWHFGPGVLDLPTRRLARQTVSFAHTGYHVLRGKAEESFGAFRCGTLLDRFSQIDMLHLDVWWRGQNVLIDGGTYRYNGAHAWHNHFQRTGSHNTVQLDGHDQMLHFRQFKMLYPTEAKLLRFEDTPEWTLCEGEHYGYQRLSGCTHGRSVLFLKDDLWVVVDRIAGHGAHTSRLHWLGGELPWTFDAQRNELTLATPRGPFTVTVLDENGLAFKHSDVAAGSEQPPRGWHSRYYGRKEPVPSFAVEQTGPAPQTFVTVLAAGRPAIHVENGEWAVQSLRFRIEAGIEIMQPELAV